MFRNILVHIPTERPARPVIDVAVSLTTAGRTHLDGIAIGYEIHGLCRPGGRRRLRRCRGDGSRT